MRTVIAITCSTAMAPGNPTQRRDFVNQAYAEAVRRAGGAPLLVPPARDRSSVGAVLERVDGLLITGGVDVSPEVYGEERHPTCGEADPDRDHLDRWFLEVAHERGLPVLGICRGVQAFAAFQGGMLYQDLATEFESTLVHQQPADRRGETTHEVEVDPETRLARVVGAGPLSVNSFHHQAVRQVPPGFAITARAPDGVIEGLEASDGHWWVGVQWHPEDLAGEHPRHQALFEALVRAAAGAGPGGG